MAPNLDQISAFLGERFGPIADLTIVQGGAWSSAFSFRARQRELVLRVGPHRDDFDKELAATTWREAGLHVPGVIDVGEAFDGHYIVSQFHHGTKLADLHRSQVRGAIESLFDVLVAMRRVVLVGEGFGIWRASDGRAPAASWPEYLCAVADRDETRLVDWRRKLLLRPRANTAFHQGCAAVLQRSGDVQTTRRLVHGDLLLNHLVGPDGRVSAVFDWGNSLAGDPLYDIAWIVYCIPWFPTIDREHVLNLARRCFPDDDVDRLLPLYELHIAVASLQYMAFADDVAGLESTPDRIAQLLSTVENS